MEKTTWNKIKPLVIQLSLFVLIGGIAWFGIGYLNEGIQEKKDRVQELGVLSENRYKQMNKLPDLRVQHEFILENEKALDIILTKERLVEFIRVLERLASEGNVEIVMVSRDNALLESKTTVVAPSLKKETPKPVSDEDPVSKKPVEKETGILSELPLPDYLRLTLTVTGAYPAVIEYLHRVETLPYALDVVGVTLTEHIETN
ncbi:MAG: hypothetical protein ABI747_04310, partial [Candidatus Moraniibacteriota bacterium]